MVELTEARLSRTAIVLTPDEQELGTHVTELPRQHLHIVPSFLAGTEEADELARRLASPLAQNVFEISSLESRIERGRLVQRLGGSVLHNIHDEILTVLEDMNIPIHAKPFKEGTVQTWYKGTWKIPETRTAIGRVLLTQEKQGIGGWRKVLERKLSQPNHDFRTDVDTLRYNQLMSIKK